MIRTSAVQLTGIPAVAYRQKLASGGSGITILRPDAAQPGIASISKTSGEPILAPNCPAELYPAEAFSEAMRLTAGMPYRRLEGIRVTEDMVLSTPEEPEEESRELRELDVIVSSEEYGRIVDAYTDKNGRLSYDLLNRDLIQTAHKSGQVRLMIEDMAPADEIRLEVVKARLKQLTRNPTLTDAQIRKLAELLDEVSPRGVFRPLNDELRGWLRDSRRRNDA